MNFWDKLAIALDGCSWPKLVYFWGGSRLWLRVCLFEPPLVIARFLTDVAPLHVPIVVIISTPCACPHPGALRFLGIAKGVLASLLEAASAALLMADTCD